MPPKPKILLFDDQTLFCLTLPAALKGRVDVIGIHSQADAAAMIAAHGDAAIAVIDGCMNSEQKFDGDVILNLLDEAGFRGKRIGFSTKEEAENLFGARCDYIVPKGAARIDGKPPLVAVIETCLARMLAETGAADMGNLPRTGKLNPTLVLGLAQT